jgi:hypothetical protein
MPRLNLEPLGHDIPVAVALAVDEVAMGVVEELDVEVEMELGVAALEIDELVSEELTTEEVELDEEVDVGVAELELDEEEETAGCTIWPRETPIFVRDGTHTLKIRQYVPSTLPLIVGLFFVFFK